MIVPTLQTHHKFKNRRGGNPIMDVEEHIDNLKEQMENLERAAQETFRRWTRRKNLTILLFLALYFLVEGALWYNREYGPFVPEQVILIVGALPIIFITLLFAHLAVRIVSPFISQFFKDELEPEQRIFFVKIFEIVIYFVALGYLLYSFGVTPASLALVAGFISGGLAFALRDVVMAFLVWLIILSKKPLRIGDTVRIGDYEGRVERIGTFFLTLSSSGKISEQGGAFGERYVRIPNGLIFQSPIENYGKADLPQVLRMQARKLPKDLEGFLTKVRVTAIDTLRRNGVERDVSVSIERQNAGPGDRDFIAIAYEAPLRGRSLLRSKLVGAMLSLDRKAFSESK